MMMMRFRCKTPLHNLLFINVSSTITGQSLESIIADFTTHGGSHLYGLPCPFADSLDPMDHFCTFDVSKIISKNMPYLLHVTFKPNLAYIRKFDTQTRVHWDVCISPNIFGVFLDVCLNHLSLGLPYALRSLGLDPPLPLWSAIQGTPWIH